MIELALRNKKLPPRLRTTHTTICGTCGQPPKYCQCAEEQEQRKREEMKEAENMP